MWPSSTLRSTKTALAQGKACPLLISVRSKTTLSLVEAAKGLRDGSYTASQLLESCLDAANRYNELNSFITRLDESAKLQAHAADSQLTDCKAERHLLLGIPVAVKDNYCVKDTKTTCASKMLSNFVSPYTATVVDRLQTAGAVLIGKTNLDEFAMGSGNTESYYGPAINPHRGPNGEAVVAGGSSGGSAVAVAAGMCYGALGSDTGGSVRLPAAFCGVVGLKPTYGRCSRFGLVSYASSLDVPGVLARSVTDAAVILECMSGQDPRDPTTLKSSSTESIIPSSNISDLSCVTIGIPQEYHIEQLSDDVYNTWMHTVNALEEKGAKIVNVSLPHTQAALATYYVLAPAEAASNLARYDGVRYGYSAPALEGELPYVRSRGEGFGQEVKDRIMLGTFCLSRSSYQSYYVKAQQIRRLIRNDFLNVFDQGITALLTPTSATTAPLLQDWSKLTAVQKNASDVFTVPASLAGLPAVSVPSGKGTTGLPIGLQIIGKQLDERTVLRIAHVVEQCHK